MLLLPTSVPGNTAVTVLGWVVLLMTMHRHGRRLFRLLGWPFASFWRWLQPLITISKLVSQVTRAVCILLWTSGVDHMPLSMSSRVSTRPAEDAARLLASIGTHKKDVVSPHFRHWLSMSLYNISMDDPNAQRVLDRMSQGSNARTRAGARTVMNHVSRRAGIPPLVLLQSCPHVISYYLTVELEAMLADDKIMKSTAANYAEQGYQILRRTPGVPPEDLIRLKEYIKGLNKTGARQPQRQAPPLTLSQFRTLMNHPSLQGPENLPMRAVIWVAWKTCSRVDEVRNLKRGLKTTDHPNELLINWGGATKTSVLHPFAPRFHTLLSWNHAESSVPDTQLLAYLTEGTGTLGHGVKTSDVATTMQRILGNPALGAHSIKRGAIDHLWSLTINPPEVEAIEMVAKHQSPKNAPLGEVHIRYISNNMHNALRRLKSHLVTSRL